ncbi:hypothetical protein CYY_003922 [Polysphondylium violaceum]|uniref:Uncharacterized protein n=1 Tax=Polysphondylium violaceum TaxID=133409 RepID=A0A8J4UTH2_9MYCE|nr:hypothetical protein CYY_003922 [Polysphondylium violaceum]
MDIISSTQSSPKIDENVYTSNNNNQQQQQLDDITLKTVVVEQPPQPLSASYHSQTSALDHQHTTHHYATSMHAATTATSTTATTLSSVKSKRNSDSFDPKELRVSELETSSLDSTSSSTNKRHSLQLLSSYGGLGSNSLFNSSTNSTSKSPYDSPSKLSSKHLSLVFNSIKKNQPPANKFGESVNAIIPPSPHYTVRKTHTSQIQFPSTPQQERKSATEDPDTPLLDQDLEFGYQSMSAAQSFNPETFVQDLLSNPQGEISEQQLESILVNLVGPDPDNIADILSKIPSERGIIHNSELLKLFNHHIMDIIDNEDEDIKNHPLNSLGQSSINSNHSSNGISGHHNSLSNKTNYSNSSSNNHVIDIISQDNSLMINNRNGPYEYEGVGTNTSLQGQKQTDTEPLLIQVEMLTKELILKNENEKDLMNKKKLLEEDNQRLLEEIKNKDQEQTKLRKEVAAKKEIDKKKNELATEVEHYRQKEIQSTKQTDELRKQITQLTTKLKQKKTEMMEIEKEKETKDEQLTKLESENKNLKIKLNSQNQKYEEIINQMVLMDNGNNGNGNNSTPSTQSPPLMSSDMLSTNVNILNSSTNLHQQNDSNQQQQQQQQYHQYRTLDQSLFRQSQLNDQKTFITPSGDHNMFFKEMELTIDSLQKENTELKEEIKELKDLNSSLEATKSKLFNELTNELNLVSEMSQSSFNNVQLVEELCMSFNNLCNFIQDSTVLPFGQNQQTCLTSLTNNNSANSDTQLQKSLNDLNCKWNQLFIEVSQIKSHQNSTIERLLKKNESFTSIINNKNETIKKQEDKIEKLEQNSQSQLSSTEIRKTISNTFEQFDKSNSIKNNNTTDQNQEQEEQVNTTTLAINNKKGGSRIFNAFRNLLSLTGLYFLFLLFVTLFIKPNRLECIS